jgi:hypothetical protein
MWFPIPLTVNSSKPEVTGVEKHQRYKVKLGGNREGNTLSLSVLLADVE